MMSSANGDALPETMRGVWLIGHGDVDQLAFRDDIPRPVPGVGDVLIRVSAAAVNNTDINTRLAWYSKRDAEADDASWSGTPFVFPRIQGADVCGHIVAVGDGVDGERVGERVLVEPCLQEANGGALPRPWYLGSECDGGFAEYVVVAARHVYRVESPLSDVELASFPCAYSTAENLLTKTHVVGGETIVVTGASGGVGAAAVQVGKARGTRVIAITSGDKAELVHSLGADQVVDRETRLIDALEEKSIDVVIDLVAGPQWPDLLAVLRNGGRYGVAGAIGGHDVPLDVRTLYLKDLSLIGGTVLEPGVFQALIARIEGGEIAPVVASTYPLEDIASAQNAFQEKRHVGKIVLRI
ncbi:MAG: alcohol dehydrogenase family protein [Pseudomonadota bacterium]